MDKVKYRLSQYCEALERGNYTILCNTSNGQTLRLPAECWYVIKKYINTYSISEICDAADKDDKEYFEQIFELMKQKKMIVVNENDDSFEIKSVDIVITNRCNLQCIHCCADAVTEVEKDLLSTEKIKEIVDQVILLNPKAIIITGGEPMVRKDFFEICEYIRIRYSGHMNLMTNGLLITDDNVQDIIRIFNGGLSTVN